MPWGACCSLFIDGTVEGTDIYLIDTNNTHDHTYYGNGCSTAEYPEGEDGSTKSCATRIINDGNNQNQKNGTYYNYQAGTNGSGAVISADNTNSPDSFCPLGWQLPYSGTGGDYYDKSRSWDYLFTTYSISFNDGSVADAIKIKSYPFSYAYSGFYRWNSGRLYAQLFSHLSWSSTINNENSIYNLATYSTYVGSAYKTVKSYGNSIRCAHRFSILS